MEWVQTVSDIGFPIVVAVICLWTIINIGKEVIQRLFAIILKQLEECLEKINSIEHDINKLQHADKNNKDDINNISSVIADIKINLKILNDKITDIINNRKK